MHSPYSILRTAGHVQTRHDKNSVAIRLVVENIRETIQELPPEAQVDRKPTAREQPYATDGRFDGIDELLAKAGAFVVIPVTGKRDVGNSGGVKPNLWHYCSSLRRTSSHSTSSASPLSMASNLASSSSR